MHRYGSYLTLERDLTERWEGERLTELSGTMHRYRKLFDFGRGGRLTELSGTMLRYRKLFDFGSGGKADRAVWHYA